MKTLHVYSLPLTVRHVCVGAFFITSLSGCATISESSIGKMANAALETVGLKEPEEDGDAGDPKALRVVKVNLNAGSNLNAAQNKPLALAVKIYHLKNANAFLQAPLNTFTDPATEKAVLGADLIAARDITLLPEQQYAVAEKVSGEANAIGVVALFHSPAPRRWKFVFDAKRAEKTGIKLGVHACAMTVVGGEVFTPPGALKEEALNQLALVKCES